MVSLERACDGILTLKFLPPYGTNDGRAYLDALAEVSRTNESYALLSVFREGGLLSREDKREQALWFKTTRERMNRTCRGLAIVRPGVGSQMAETYRKLWSFPVTMAQDEPAARSILLVLLRGRH
jgi:hypothetical protein